MFKVVLVGRPNVGKSTLFNRLVSSQKAIVNDQPGVTRDRKYGQASLVDLNFILVDTAGIDDSLKGNTENKILQQSQFAINDANIEDHYVWWAVCFPELAGEDPLTLKSKARGLGYSTYLVESQKVLLRSRR